MLRPVGPAIAIAVFITGPNSLTVAAHTHNKGRSEIAYTGT